jgi:hypothetical protein
MVKTRRKCRTEGGGNYMANETTATMPVTTRSKPPSAIFKHIIALCGFPDDSSQVEIVQEQEWMDLTDAIILTLDDFSVSH